MSARECATTNALTRKLKEYRVHTVSASFRKSASSWENCGGSDESAKCDGVDGRSRLDVFPMETRRARLRRVVLRLSSSRPM